jgi:hypothetical protein
VFRVAISQVASLDRDFDHVEGVRRLFREPAPPPAQEARARLTLRMARYGKPFDAREAF